MEKNDKFGLAQGARVQWLNSEGCLSVVWKSFDMIAACFPFLKARLSCLR